MICPNCGKQISDGNVYCEKCGQEIFIITEEIDDPAVTSAMNSTMSNISDVEFIDDGMEFDDEPNVFSLILSGRAGGKGFYIGLGVLLLIVIVFSMVLVKKINSTKGLDYQLEQAELEIQNNNLASAIEYLENAYRIDKDVSHLFLIADCYNSLDRDNDALSTLIDIADNTKNKEEDRISAYKKIISLYSNVGNYQKLNTLISECDIEAIKTGYSKYLTEEPIFNYEGGTYEEVISLKLASKLNGGTIYYTFGNSTPTENSEMYDAPIELSFGSYTVNAIYVNEFGVASDVVTQKYLIDVDFLFEPEILLDSGSYYSAQVITANIPSLYTLYYTTDGTVPDKSSIRYTGPIALPMGDSTFKFIEYAVDGTVSTVVERNYSLYIDTLINDETAIPFLMNVLVQKGINTDIDGHRNGYGGNFIYIFTTAYHIDSKKADYFFIVEYYVDEYGNTRKTGDVYAMHVTNANKLFKVTSLNGTYTLNNF